MAQDLIFILVVIAAISLSLMCAHPVLSRGAAIARQQRAAEALRQAERRVPAGQRPGPARANSILRPAPVYLYDARPPSVHAHPNTDEVAIEPLPVYEAPPPQYNSIIKEAQSSSDMRDLERGEPSGSAEADNNPPEYDQASGGDEVAVVVRVATDGSHMTAPEDERRRGIFSMTRPFYGSGLLGRLWR